MLIRKRIVTFFLAALVPFTIVWSIPLYFQFSLWQQVAIIANIAIILSIIIYYYLWDSLLSIILAAKKLSFWQRIASAAGILALVLFLAALIHSRWETGHINKLYQLQFSYFEADSSQGEVSLLLSGAGEDHIPLGEDFDGTYHEATNSLELSSTGDYMKTELVTANSVLGVCFNLNEVDSAVVELLVNRRTTAFEFEGADGRVCRNIRLPYNTASAVSINGIQLAQRIATPIGLFLILLLGGAAVSSILRAKHWRKGLYSRLEAFSASVKKEVSEHHVYLVVLLFFAVIAYGMIAFNVLLTGDNYGALVRDGFQQRWVIANGRWMQGVIWQLAGNNYPATSFSLSILIGSGIVSGWIVAKMVKIKNKFATFIFIAIFVFHPFWAQSAISRMGNLNAAVGIFLACLYGLTAWVASKNFLVSKDFKWGFTWAWFSSLLVAFSASSNQVFLLYGVVAYQGALLSDLLAYKQLKNPVREWLFHYVILGGISILGVIQYYVLAQGVRIISRVSATEGAYSESLITSMSSFVAQLRVVGRYLAQFFFQPQHLYPMAGKIIFLIFLGSLIFLILFPPKRFSKDKRRTLIKALSALVLFLIVLTPWIFGFIREPLNSFRYSALRANAVSTAIIVGLVLDRVKRGSLAPYFHKILGFSLVLIFLFQHSVAYNVNRNIHTRDLAIANRILYMIETNPDFGLLTKDGVIEVRMVGYRAIPEVRPFVAPTTAGPFNWSMIQCGVLDCQPVRLDDLLFLIQYYPYMRFRTVLTPSQNAFTEADASVIETMEPWPSVNSVRVYNPTTVYIFFSDPNN